MQENGYSLLKHCKESSSFTHNCHFIPSCSFPNTAGSFAKPSYAVKSYTQQDEWIYLTIQVTT